MRMLTALIFGLLCLPASLTQAQDAELPAPYREDAVYEELGDETPPADEPVAKGETVPPTPEQERFRTQNTEFGAAGGLHVVDAGGGVVGTFRLQLSLAYFSSSDFLETGDEASRTSGVLSMGVTVTDFLEVFGAIENRATSNSTSDPTLLQVLGDVSLGIKGYVSVLPWLTVGGDLSLTFLNAVGDIGLRLDGTNLGLRGNASADLRRLHDPLPLIVRANLGYVFDNSASLIEDVEKARVAVNGDVSEASFISRAERFGLGINRIDHLGLALGVEVPLPIDEQWAVHPLAEYTLKVGINRQGYSCLEVATSAGVGERDGCLALQGLAAMPATLSLGARVFTPFTGLSALLAADIGLAGSSTFVRELAPNAPYELRLALAYAYDPRPQEAAVREVEVVREVDKAPPPKARIDGLILEQGTDVPVVGAVVQYVGLDFSGQVSDERGRFVSYGLPEGPVSLQVTHPDYEPGSCTATMPAPGYAFAAPAPGPAAPASPVEGTITALGPVDAEGNPVGAQEEGQLGAFGAQGRAQIELGSNAGIGASTLQGEASAAGAPPVEAGAATETVALPSSSDGALVALRCELVAKPRQGSLSGILVDEDGSPVPGTTIELSGPSSLSLTSDDGGAFSSAELKAGTYAVRVDAAVYMFKMASVTVPAGGQATLRIELTRKPKTAQVQMSSNEVKIRRQIMFKTNSAEISERSHGLLDEIADVLQRNPQVERVEIQGHTDNRGDAELNRQLSQMRAESVRKYLIEAGVAADRLDAKGYGDTRPLVPNLTEQNRARNRRVQFMIRR